MAYGINTGKNVAVASCLIYKQILNGPGAYGRYTIPGLDLSQRGSFVFVAQLAHYSSKGSDAFLAVPVGGNQFDIVQGLYYADSTDYSVLMVFGCPPPSSYGMAIRDDDGSMLATTDYRTLELVAQGTASYSSYNASDGGTYNYGVLLSSLAETYGPDNLIAAVRFPPGVPFKSGSSVSGNWGWGGTVPGDGSRGWLVSAEVKSSVAYTMEYIVFANKQLSNTGSTQGLLLWDGNGTKVYDSNLSVMNIVGSNMVNWGNTPSSGSVYNYPTKNPTSQMPYITSQGWTGIQNAGDQNGDGVPEAYGIYMSTDSASYVSSRKLYLPDTYGANERMVNTSCASVILV